MVETHRVANRKPLVLSGGSWREANLRMALGVASNTESLNGFRHWMQGCCLICMAAATCRLAYFAQAGGALATV